MVCQAPDGSLDGRRLPPAVDITLYGGEKSTRALGLPEAPSPKHEYSSLALTLELVDSMDEAIDHIHKFGSAHTESIVTGAISWRGPLSKAA